MKILRKTTALCRRCHTSHPAEVVLRENQVIAITHCPEQDDEVVLSRNPELYQALSGQSTVPLSDAPPAGLKYVLNYLSITNACNFHCAVCAANAGGPDKQTFITLDEICRRARQARNEGARILHLFGGEPTLHPDLHTIIRRLSEMGLSVGLVTNGFMLGRDPQFAIDLKQNGLQRVCLQFDSFCRESLNLLARSYLDQKQKAIRHALDAGLRVGLNCTTTQRTLSELGSLIDHGVSLGSGVLNMTFACAAPVGRFQIPIDDTVDREQILAAMVGSGGQSYFRLEDVHTLPAFLPWGLHTHPDCGVHVMLLRHPGGALPLNHFIDLRRFYRRLARTRRKATFFSTRVLPLWHLSGCVRVRKLPSLLRRAAGILLRQEGYGLLNIGVTDYRAAVFLDEQRLQRCASAFRTSVGPVCACLHYFQGPDVPGSLEYEAAHQSC